jgi:hypothetical protein
MLIRSLGLILVKNYLLNFVESQVTNPPHPQHADNFELSHIVRPFLATNDAPHDVN